MSPLGLEGALGRKGVSLASALYLQCPEQCILQNNEE